MNIALPNYNDLIKTSKARVVEQILKLKGKNISFDDYPISKEILNCKANRILLFGGRQISKSFTLGVDILADMMVYPYLYTLYIAPSVSQVKTFSTVKLNARMKESPFFMKWFIDKHCTQNVHEKSFTTEARLFLKAETQLEFIRGIEAAKTRFDEVQDIAWESIIIIEACLDGQPEWWKYYAGTAKSLNNPIELLRQKSNQIVPVLRCPECNYHNVPGIDNIKPEGLMCKSCKGGRLSVRQPYLTMRSIENPNSDLVSFWIPQIALPLHVESPTKWAEVVKKLHENPIDKFKNEVMGISAGSALQTVTEEELQACCKFDNQVDAFPMMHDGLEGNWINIPCLYAGVDWMINGGTSSTVLTIGGYNTYTGRMTVIYKEKIHITDCDEVCVYIARKLRQFGVKNVASDWGAGFDKNNKLKKICTPMNINVYPMIYTQIKEEMKWDELGARYSLNRNTSLRNTFQAIRNRKFHFFEWEQFKYFASDFLAEKLEEGVDKNGNATQKYDHNPDDPDDSLHSTNLMLALFRFFEDPDDSKYHLCVNDPEISPNQLHEIENDSFMYPVASQHELFDGMIA